jgi:predicted permease
MRKFMNRLRALFRSRKVSREMAEEMQHHLESQIELNIEAGMSPEEARYAARRSFGNVGNLQETARDQRGFPWVEDFFRDCVYAIKGLQKSRGFTVIAVLTLGLGIGASTSSFSVVYSVLFQSLPFPRAGELVYIWQWYGATGEPGISSPYFFKRWREHSTLLQGIAMHTGFENASATLTGGSAPEYLPGLYVSANYLGVLQIAPILGRDFATDSDSFGGQNNVLIISHRMWQTRFGGNHDVINRSIILDEVPHTIIGVLPATGIPRSDVLFLRPFVLNDPAKSLYTRPQSRFISVTGRLKPGVTPQQLSAELNVLQTKLREELPVQMRDTPGPLVTAFREQLTGTMRPTLIMLLGVGSLLLVIACANVANLLLVHAAARRKEIAVRMALGAGVRRIVSQVLAKSLVLSLLGSGLAMIAVVWVADFLGPVTEAVRPSLSNMQRAIREQVVGASLPAVLQPQVNWVVFAYSIALALGTSVAAGLFPAIRSCRMDLVPGLKEAERGSSAGRSRVQSVLVAVQIGLTAILLVGSGLLLRSLFKVLAIEPGFEARRAIAFDLVTPRVKYPDVERAIRFGEEAVRVLAALRSVEAVGTTHNPPFRGVRHEGIALPDAEPGTGFSAFHSAVAGDYFGALAIPLRRGRTFTTADNIAGAPPVVVISEALAHALFGEKDPIGQRVRSKSGIAQVVGVVGNVRQLSLELPAEVQYYEPSRIFPWTPTVIVRTTGSSPSNALLNTIREAIRSVDPDQPLGNFRHVDELIGSTLRGKRAMLGLVFAFALGALFLACIGIYGVVAFTVSQRERELGIRMALGASQRGVVRMVFRDGAQLSILGLAAGLISALALARLIASLLFGVTPHDPAVFATVAMVVAAIAALACWLPARRAARVDPMIALRAD